MQFIFIRIDEPPKELIYYMKKESAKKYESNNVYLFEEQKDLENCSILCRIKDDGLSYDLNDEKRTKEFDELVALVSNIIADYIIKNYENKILKRIINTNYCYFSLFERSKILRFAIDFINTDDQYFINGIHRIRRRNIIIRKLHDYFESSNTIIIDGFVNFRLKEYIKELESVVESAVGEFLKDREYKEFIQLLKYFVNIQDSKYKLLHIVFNKNNKYQIMDETKREITDECINEFSADFIASEINYDDLLISSLITLAPKKIKIHNVASFSNKELIDTIKNIFTGRVIICESCQICLQILAKA